MIHTITLTRVLVQTLTVEVELQDDAPTDAEILGAAVDESRTYFDTDWRTKKLVYSWEPGK